MPCDSINNHILQQEDNKFLWKLKLVTAHEEPLIASDTNYKGA